MCGIAAFFNKEGAQAPSSLANAMRWLLLSQDSRGRDNCGVYFTNLEGKKVVLRRKDELSTFSKFFSKEPFAFNPALDSTILGHSRKGSLGADFLENTHPFVLPSGIVGVHNGTVRSWESLAKELKVDVTGVDNDSKAFFIMIDAVGPEKVFSSYTREATGGGAWVWTNHKTNESFVFVGLTSLKGQERPLHYAQTPYGILVSSEDTPLLQVKVIFPELGITKISPFVGDSIIKIVDGEIVDTVPVERKNFTTSFSNTTTYQSNTTQLTKTTNAVTANQEALFVGGGFLNTAFTGVHKQLSVRNYSYYYGTVLLNNVLSNTEMFIDLDSPNSLYYKNGEQLFHYLTTPALPVKDASNLRLEKVWFSNGKLLSTASYEKKITIIKTPTSVSTVPNYYTTGNISILYYKFPYVETYILKDTKTQKSVYINPPYSEFLFDMYDIKFSKLYFKDDFSTIGYPDEAQADVTQLKCFKYFEGMLCSHEGCSNLRHVLSKNKACVEHSENLVSTNRYTKDSNLIINIPKHRLAHVQKELNNNFYKGLFYFVCLHAYVLDSKFPEVKLILNEMLNKEPVTSVSEYYYSSLLKIKFGV